MQMDYQKRFPIYLAALFQVANFGHGSACLEGLNFLLVKWERVVIFRCILNQHPENPLNHSYNSLFLDAYSFEP